MAVNQKLTNVIKGRVVQNFQLNASEVLISFADGSTMKVKIVESDSQQLRQGARIRQVSEITQNLSSNARTTVQSR